MPVHEGQISSVEGCAEETYWRISSKIGCSLKVSMTEIWIEVDNWATNGYSSWSDRRFRSYTLEKSKPEQSTGFQKIEKCHFRPEIAYFIQTVILIWNFDLFPDHRIFVLLSMCFLDLSGIFWPHNERIPSRHLWILLLPQIAKSFNEF